MGKKRDYGKIIPEIIKLKEEGFKKRQALYELRQRGFKIRDSKFYELAREIWEYEYICVKRVKIWFRNATKAKPYIISATEYSEREILQMIRDYKFEEETEYDMVEVESWRSRRKEDRQYILTYKRLMAIYVLIIRNAKYLSLQNLIDITQGLILEFFDENVRHKKTHLRFLSKVLRILESKEEEMEWF